MLVKKLAVAQRIRKAMDDQNIEDGNGKMVIGLKLEPY